MPFTEMHSSLGLYSFLQSCLTTGWWHLAPTHTVLVHLLHHPSTACWTSCSNLFYEKPQTQQTEIYNAFLFEISNAQVSFPLDFTVSINRVSSCFNELRTLKKVCAQATLSNMPPFHFSWVIVLLQANWPASSLSGSFHSNLTITVLN